MAYKKICESEYGRGENNFHVSRMDKVLSVELTYPQITDAGCDTVEVNQESVRASDGIRIKYDYDRDGFVIMQPKPWARDSEADPNLIETGDDWVEVYFCQSWALGDLDDELEKLTTMTSE